MTDHYRVTEITRVDITPPMRVAVADRTTIAVARVELHAHPNGWSMITASGRYIRVDDTPGRQHRHVCWTTGGAPATPDEVPAQIRAIADEVRPGWWPA